MLLKTYLCADNAPLEQIVQAISKGSPLHKARTYLKFYKRNYHVDLKSMRLKYGPSRKLCSREGWHTDTFNDIKSDWRVEITREDIKRRHPYLCEEHSFSVVSGHDVLDLVAPSREIRDAWVKGLEHLVQTCKSERRKEQHDRWLKEQFAKADVSKTNSLNFQECLALLNNLNINMEKGHVKQLFDKANYKHEKHKGHDVLDKEEFVKFYHMLLQRPELEEIFKKFSINNATIMGPEELLKFLVNEQKLGCVVQMTDATIEDCQRLIEQFEPQENQVELQGAMSPQDGGALFTHNSYNLRVCLCVSLMFAPGFSDMLASDAFSIFRKEHKQVCQDMEQPLNNYFVASSHNTYLLAGQLMGDSSVEGYIRALQRGCRCLELDCWDGVDDEPIIYHGYTLTTQILFVDVLTAIRDYAFKASPYALPRLPRFLRLQAATIIDSQEEDTGEGVFTGSYIVPSHTINFHRIFGPPTLGIFASNNTL
ncbi:hypothetical protein LAZ67_17003070 [Cordylochernes scorpioides]|uniref:Phosphoinositide phospholipase C n=1 Tax=Cordylochernes scorpioides TaxID=51811 RepID=A0ABY6LJ94_9ARAC|nr:hypothetical protein LAZ67_17003070 [Cordylochernes scorpioides]